MADLEEHAIKRDKRFLVRLVLLLGIGLLAGILLWYWMTGAEVSGCAAQSFGDVTGSAPAEGTGR